MSIAAPLLAFVVFVVVAWILLRLSGHSAILKDQMIPQIPPKLQTYSLARSQMAFWLLLILTGFIYLFIRTGSLDLITGQALTLMGISGLTAGASASVDNYQETPQDRLNDGLKALGISNYQDVLDLDKAIASLQSQASGLSIVGQAKLNDMLLLKQSYINRTKPFVTEGWFNDLTTDVDGVALHRLQALIWTVLLGAIFMWEIYKTQAMPQFSDNLLILLGVSNAGYVGFKMNETQY